MATVIEVILVSADVVSGKLKGTPPLPPGMVQATVIIFRMMTTVSVKVSGRFN
jgi:hypothetical protein